MFFNLRFIYFHTSRNLQTPTENIEGMQKRLQDMEKALQENDAKYKTLASHMDDVRTVVYDIVVGVYNHETQSAIIKQHANRLYPTEEHDQDTDSDVYMWPTTRQGDECESRIIDLEVKLLKMQQQIDSMENFYKQSQEETRLVWRRNLERILHILQAEQGNAVDIAHDNR